MARKLYDWKAAQEYHDEGHGFVESAQRFGFTYQGWAKAIKRGRLQLSPSLFDDRRRRYDWCAIQAYYEAGATFRECKARFGFHAGAWAKAVRWQEPLQH